MSENLSNKKITLSQKQAKKSSDIRDYILAGSTGCRRSSVPLGAIIFAENQKTFNEMKEDPITRKYFEKYIMCDFEPQVYVALIKAYKNFDDLEKFKDIDFLIRPQLPPQAVTQVIDIAINNQELTKEDLVKLYKNCNI